MADATIYVTNLAAARARTPGVAGRGNVWSIMARPNVAAGEAGHGRCWPLVPVALDATPDARAALNVAKVHDQVNFDDQRSALARERDVPELDMVGVIQRSRDIAGLVRMRDHYLDGPALHVDGSTYAPSRALHPDLKPRNLLAQANAGRGLHEVKGGDTLICSCGAEKARDGKCHRVWAGVLLAAHGWRVVLDGAEIDVRHPPEHMRGLWPRQSSGRRAA